jgi:uncharacterized protein (TIGR02246 family)
LLTVFALMVSLAARPALAGQAKGDPKDKEAIQKNGEAFVAAFHKGDARAVAAFWTEDGDFTDQTGQQLKGRDAIEKAFRGLFAENKDLKVRINSLSLRFVTPDVAIEDGTNEVFPPDGGPPSRARYTIVHVKKDGQWRLSSVRETAFTPPSNYEHLRGLEWAIGDWAGEGEKGEGERISLAWSEGQNFIVGTFTTSHRNIAVGNATQWIGWDPLAKRIRSWVFDASGAFGEGSWTKEGNKWLIKSSLVLPDGKRATATFIVAPVDADTITLQSKDRTANGNRLPDTKEVRLKRIK